MVHWHYDTHKLFAAEIAVHTFASECEKAKKNTTPTAIDKILKQNKVHTYYYYYLF